MQAQLIVSQSNIPKRQVSRERNGDYLQAVAAVVGRERGEQRRLREFERERMLRKLCVFAIFLSFPKKKNV
jgi:hypothetical protein